MGKGFKITPVLGGLSTKWTNGNGKALVAQKANDEIEWPLGEITQAPKNTTSLETLGFNGHFADNPHARETFEQTQKDRELQLRPARAHSALTHDGGM